MVPQAGMSGFVTVAPIVVGEILVNAGILFDAEKSWIAYLDEIFSNIL